MVGLKTCALGIESLYQLDVAPGCWDFSRM